MAKKKRADLLAVEQGLAATQRLAASLIMAGKLFRLQGEDLLKRVRVEKAGDMLPESTQLELQASERYVSRGAYKLVTALEHFAIDVQGLVALDAGASTGGFTDCLLQHGASRVYAVDVGYNQLHEKLRADPRVVSLESVNLRLAGPELLPEKVDLLVADVSFISLKAILPSCLYFLKPTGLVVALIKPQFEVSPDKNIKGVVHDAAVRQEAVDGVVMFAGELGLQLQGVIPAAIKGPKGNQEYLAFWHYLAAQQG